MAYIIAIPTAVKQQHQLLIAGFDALCTTRAYRWSQGELTLQQAVDFLQTWADHQDLTRHIGHDAVQAIMSNAFAPYRDDLP